MRIKANRKESGKAPGFTLVEVMVTLTILGLIVLMIFGVFRLGLSAWEKGETAKEAYQEIRMISQLISQQIKSAVPYMIKTKKAEGNYLAFEGKASSLKFVSALPIKSKQPEGFVFVTYEFKEGAERGGRLILYEQKVLNRDFFEEAQKEESAIPLLEKVSAVRFEYFREEDPSKNQEEEWLEEWNTKEEKRLPKALKMIITHKNGKKEEKEFSTTLLVSLPAHRFEEVRIGPVIRRPMFEKPR